MSEKAALWQRWIQNTLHRDLADDESQDPIPLFEPGDDEYPLSDELGSYKWGMNDGNYLYLLYLLDGDGIDPTDIVPVYVGESSNISSRITQHASKIRDALPTSEWEDDGSWGNWSKYDHMAAVFEQAGPLYAWIVDVDELDHGPYGDDTYRQELEAKLVGLVHDQPEYERVFANREFVPNRILHEIGKVGPEWVQIPNETPPIAEQHPPFDEAVSKKKCWEDWVAAYVQSDIEDAETEDPIPLFETDEEGRVELTEKDRLKRSARIDERIRREGLRCVHADGVRDEGYDGLLYLMYQLDGDRTVVPRYLGKAEAYGKKRELSSNFVEIAKERDATRSFARWGDGDYWHVGELSLALRGSDSRKAHWAAALFEPGTRVLSKPVYLWVRAWHSDRDTGPYGVPATLAEVEPLLIGVAYDAYQERLLNKEGTPDIAAPRLADSTFELKGE